MRALLFFVQERNYVQHQRECPRGEAVVYMVTRNRHVAVSKMLVRAGAQTW